VARQAVRRVTFHFDAFTRADADVGRTFAANVLLAAIAAVKTADAPVPRIREIVQQALQKRSRSNRTARNRNDGRRDERRTRCSRVQRGRLRAAGLRQYSRTKQQAGIICAGALKGAGAEASSTLKDQAALNLPVPFAAYTTIVCNAFTAATTAPPTTPFDVARFITLNNADYIPATMIGAIAGDPAAAAKSCAAA